jgi:hypothetical protein
MNPAAKLFRRLPLTFKIKTSIIYIFITVKKRMEVTLSAEEVKRLASKQDDPIDWNLVLYFILGTVAFYTLSYPIAKFFASGYLSDYNTSKFTFSPEL